MMSDDVTSYLKDYNSKVSHHMPGRTVFFPNSKDEVYNRLWLDVEFKRVVERAGLKQFGNNAPRVYDFRHSFATHRLYQWMREGKDLDAMLPYLSAYMGHTSIECTYYYIHLVPGIFAEMSGADYSHLEKLIPEVECDE
jgi:integrase